MKQYTKKTIPLSDILVNPKNPHLFTSGILCILLIATGTAFADSSLSITTDDPIYKIGDTILINLTNNADEPAIFNYKMLNSNDDNFAQKCVTDNNTSGVILPSDTQLILVHTSCAGMSSIGDWVVSSKLTHDGKLVDLFTSTKFSIVVELPESPQIQTQTQIHSEKYLNSTYPKRENIPSHIQNNTGWNRAAFDDYFLYPLVDEFGIVIFPILTKNDDFYVDFGTEEKISYFKSLENYEKKIYRQYSKEVGIIDGKISYVQISEKNDDDALLAFPRVFNLDQVYVGQGNSSLIINDTHTPYFIPRDHGGIILDFNIMTTFNHPQIIKLYDYIFPPLKQIQNGVLQINIICKENLDIVLRPSDSPACVKPESIPRLVEQGWIKVN